MWSPPVRTHIGSPYSVRYPTRIRALLNQIPEANAGQCIFDSMDWKSMKKTVSGECSWGLYVLFCTYMGYMP